MSRGADSKRTPLSRHVALFDKDHAEHDQVVGVSGCRLLERSLRCPNICHLALQSAISRVLRTTRFLQDGDQLR